MMSTITTFTKKKIDPMNPSEEAIDETDIAHALSLMTRANGHFPEFYSVAQHCNACCNEAEARGYSARVVLGCLLHDASEAYLSDITRPVKQYLEVYQQAESIFQSKVYTKFLGTDLTEEERHLVQNVDDSLLYYEFKHYMGEELPVEKSELKAETNFAPYDFLACELEFLSLLEIWKGKL